MFITVLGNTNITIFAKTNSRVALQRHEKNINKMVWILPGISCTLWVFRNFMVKHPIDFNLIWPFVQNQWRSRSLDSQKKWRESLGCLWMRRGEIFFWCSHKFFCATRTLQEKIKEFSAIPELVEDAMALAVARGVVMYPAPKNKREAVGWTMKTCGSGSDLEVSFGTLGSICLWGWHQQKKPVCSDKEARTCFCVQFLSNSEEIILQTQIAFSARQQWCLWHCFRVLWPTIAFIWQRSWGDLDCAWISAGFIPLGAEAEAGLSPVDGQDILHLGGKHYVVWNYKPTSLFIPD